MLEQSTIESLNRTVVTFNKAILELPSGKAGYRQTNETNIVFVIRIRVVIDPAPTINLFVTNGQQQAVRFRLHQTKVYRRLNARRSEVR